MNLTGDSPTIATVMQIQELLWDLDQTRALCKYKLKLLKIVTYNVLRAQISNGMEQLIEIISV